MRGLVCDGTTARRDESLAVAATHGVTAFRESATLIDANELGVACVWVGVGWRAFGMLLKWRGVLLGCFFGGGTGQR